MTPIAPPAGMAFWWAGPPVGATATMTRAISVPRPNATLTMTLWWEFWTGLDYAYVSVSADGGQTWTNLLARRNVSPHVFESQEEARRFLAPHER